MPDSCTSLLTKDESTFTVSPLSALNIPSNTCIKPLPPASTTPAFFNTGNNDGVNSTASLPDLITSVKKVSKSECFLFNDCACSAIILITVSIVPSFGLLTAPYAISAPFKSA